MTETRSTLVLSDADLDGLLSIDDHVRAAADAFASNADGRGLEAGLVHAVAPGGELHIKVGGFGGADSVVGIKSAGGFPGNPARGLPRGMGILALFDGHTGRTLAIMPAASIGPQRTAAATTLAATRFAPTDASVLGVCGAGRQAELHVRFLHHVLGLGSVRLWNRTRARADDLAARLTGELDLAIEVVDSPAETARGAHVVVTTTNATEWILPAASVEPGAFVAAVGTDSHTKNEIDPALFARATIIVDVPEQCLEVGDLHHAVAAGAVTPSDVAASLGEVVAGQHPGRRTAEEIILFDSTGTGFQDAAAARVAFVVATERGLGLPVDLMGR